MIAGLRDAGKTVAADDALHVRGGRSSATASRSSREGRDRGPGDAAGHSRQSVGEGAIVEIEVYGDRGRRARLGPRPARRDGRRRRGARPGAGDRDPDRSAPRSRRRSWRSSRHQARPRDDARADPRGCVRRARHRPRAGGSGMSQLLRTMTLGWKLHFEQESRNPFFLYIVIGTPLIYATMAYFLFQGGEKPGDARRGCGRLGDDGHLVADDDRGCGRVAAAAEARDPRAPRRLPDAVLGHVPADHARDLLDRHLLARDGPHLRSVPLRRARVGRRTGPRSSSPSRR